MSVPYADNIVFNFTLYNRENNSVPAELYISRDQAFIDNIENYYIRLIGAEFSTSQIPLFIYKNDMFVEIVNDGVSSRVQVQFANLFSTVINYVVFVQQFMNGVNAALREAHVNSSSPGNPPLFIYDDEEMKLIVDQQYDPNIQSIGFNDILIDKFPSFLATYNSTSNMYYMLYGQYGNNLYNSWPGGINYPIYVLRANVTQYTTLQEFLNVVVSCNSIPINKQQLNNLSITTRTLGILDVIPLYFDDVTKYTIKSYNQETPTYNDLLSRGKLSDIDFKFYLIDSNYQLVPLFIPPKTSVTCRIEFVNKKIIKNYYPLNDEGLKAATGYKLQ
jgi:hypothetical protein